MIGMGLSPHTHFHPLSLKLLPRYSHDGSTNRIPELSGRRICVCVRVCVCGVEEEKEKMILDKVWARGSSSSNSTTRKREIRVEKRGPKLQEQRKSGGPYQV